MRKTLFIGLGGLGQKVVARIKQQALQLHTSVEALRFVAIDRDESDLLQVSFGNDIPVIRLHDGQTIRDRLRQYHGLGVEEWFPDAPAVLNDAPFSTCLRAVGRLDFIHALQEGRLQLLTNLLGDMVEPGLETQPMQIVVVTSLSGGTGSGMFIQLAAWLRKTLRMTWHTSANICGVFAGPEVLIQTMQPGLTAREMLRANTCAALQELKLFTKIAEGETVPGFEDRMLDGQQLGAWENRPVYDWMELYEAQAEDALSYEQHLDRMAQAACLYYMSRLPEREGAAEKRPGVHFRRMGSAVAEYPQREILEYCSLQAAMDLNRQQNQPLTEAAQSALAQQADLLLKELMDRLQEELAVYTLPEEFYDKAKQLQKVSEVDEYLHAALRELVGRRAEAEARLSCCGEKLYRLAQECWLPEREIKNSGLLRMIGGGDTGKLWTPIQLRALLDLLVKKLKEMKNGVKETQHFDFCQPGTVPLPRGARPVAPEEGTPYLLRVWESMTASPLHRMLPHTPKNYISWFCEYCSEAMAKSRAAKEAEILLQLLPRLLRELEELQRAMVMLEDQLHRIFDSTWERHMLVAQQAGVRVCADADTKRRIYAGCTPQWNLDAVSAAYGEGLLALYREQRWPTDERHGAAGACALTMFKEILRCITGEVKQATPQLNMDILEAWCYAENAGTNVLRELCDRLGHMASENVADTGVYQPEAFGVPADCTHGQVLANMLGAQLLEEPHLRKTVLWCLQLRTGISLVDSILPAWREAYQWMCSRRGNPGEARFEPHMDKRWPADLFGVE